MIEMLHHFLHAYHYSAMLLVESIIVEYRLVDGSLTVFSVFVEDTVTHGALLTNSILTVH